MKRIVHIITSLSGGGRERRMSQLVAAMRDSADYDTHVIVFSHNNDYLADYPAKKIHFVNKNVGKVSFVRLLMRQLKALSPDIVHLWTEINTVMLAVLLSKNRLCFKLVLGYIADGNPISRFSYRKMSEWACRKADAIVSNSMAGLVAKKAPMEKSHVIYNGFDFSRFDAKPFDERKLREELSLTDKRVVTMVARFDRAKNWDMFMSVAEKFALDEDVRFLTVGDGPMTAEYKEKAASNVVFAGRRNDVENILKITSLSLLFSNSAVHAEGVSNSIMESMAAGVPVIATRGGGTAEIISDGENGFIVEPDDVDSATRLCRELVVDNPEKRNEMGEKAVDEIKSRFLLSKMTADYVVLYDNLICR
ncbi:MAG: glycosyltransferase family 4 protein [Muribaculaceae bacterium]|nr:glycosyltransferase family 4 protein [Muribaculaceae bacterium]